MKVIMNLNETVKFTNLLMRAKLHSSRLAAAQRVLPVV